jgi:hypothetical protein
MSKESGKCIKIHNPIVTVSVLLPVVMLVILHVHINIVFVILQL